MFNKLKSSSSSKNSSNIPNSLFSSKMKAIKAAVISGFMLIWWNASANNDIQDTKSLEIGDSISQKLWTTIKIQGDLATLGISSISRNTAEKVINAGSVVTALKLLDLDSSVKSRKKYIEILGLGVDLSIDENWKVIDREKNKEANNTFYRSIITSINESVIQAEKNQIDTFKILIANPSKINQQEEKTNENNISLDINSPTLLWIPPKSKPVKVKIPVFVSLFIFLILPLNKGIELKIIPFLSVDWILIIIFLFKKSISSLWETISIKKSVDSFDVLLKLIWFMRTEV